MSCGNITHHGTVAFRGGQYVRVSGSENWKVWPIAAFDPPIRVPVGQIRIDFDQPQPHPYTVLVTLRRTVDTPLGSANYGDDDERGFVIHLWETIADRTLQNSDFSFAVIQMPS